MLDLEGDGELALSSVKERLRKVTVDGLTIEEWRTRTDLIIRRSADTVLVYLGLLQRLHDFYAAASDVTKRRILAAFFTELYIDEGEHTISARGVLHEVVQTVENAASTRTPHLDRDYSLPSSGNPWSHI